MTKSQLLALFVSLFVCLSTLHSKTVLFLGDSLTAGDGLDQKYAFPALVGESIENLTTINQGRSGWATSSYLRRWDEVAAELPEQVGIVFIQLGANDLRIDGHSVHTVMQCRKNMEEILRRIENRYPSVEIVLMSATKLDPSTMTEKIRSVHFGKHSNKYISDIGEEYRSLAKARGYGFVDLHNQISMKSTIDGAHLNKGAHRQVAEILVDYLKDL
ncbi:MAG: SGNH/GDSL hydrolase family protein [Puniceicoccaceae bacterium]